MKLTFRAVLASSRQERPIYCVEYLFERLDIVEYADARDERPGATSPLQFPAFAVAAFAGNPLYSESSRSREQVRPRGESIRENNLQKYPVNLSNFMGFSRIIQNIKIKLLFSIWL